MMKLHFEKLSRYARQGEFVEAVVPFKEGQLKKPECVIICDNGRKISPQTNVTATWEDGSVKWLHLSFLTDLPGNTEKDVFLQLEGKADYELQKIILCEAEHKIDTGVLKATLAPKGSCRLFDSLENGNAFFSGEEFVGPVLGTDSGKYTICLANDWVFPEKGPYRIIAENSGKHMDKNGVPLFDFTVRLHFTAGHPWFQLEYRFVHKEKEAEIPLKSLTVCVKQDAKDAEVALGISNYHTKIVSCPASEGVEKLIDAKHLMNESNEHIPESFYGTFFADWRKGGKGVCATVYQAQQNFPKALRADENGLLVSLMPEEHKPLSIMQGMSKTHYVYFHFHNGAQMSDLNVRSLQLQMLDRPVLETSVYRDAGVVDDVFLKNVSQKLEYHLMSAFDRVSKAYGILNWGDTMEMQYTQQGRGTGKIVWTNNEYDFPHSCMLMHVHSRERRFLDMMLVSARHWMDVDICHYSEDPMRMGAHIMHGPNHVGGYITPSHEWVEGLLDYYHFTGDRRAFDYAVGIAENVLKFLDTPAFQKKGEITARETGWALRVLVAMYKETGDKRWIDRCEAIVEHFVAWKEEFGQWFSPYTDHVVVRVPFMISIAVCSLMRYYRVRPTELLKDLIVGAVKDMVDNTRLPSGHFFYKDLPSLKHGGPSPGVLEALAYAYELTGDKEYVEAGLPCFRTIMGSNITHIFDSGKVAMEDAVILGTESSRSAGLYISLAAYAKVLENADMSDELGW